MATKKESLPTTERVYEDPDFDQNYLTILDKARREGDPDWLDAAPHDVEDIVEVQGVEAILDENDEPTGEQRIVTRRVRASLVPEYERAMRDYNKQVEAAKANQAEESK